MTTALHDACVIAANQMLKDGISHHVSYTSVPDNAYSNRTGKRVVLKTTIEFVEDVETHWKDVEQQEVAP